MPDVEKILQNNSRASCWIVIEKQVYDVTDFLDEHPGGAGIILRYASKDATAEYVPIHPEDTIEKSLDRSKHFGPVHGPRDFLQPEIRDAKAEEELQDRS